MNTAADVETFIAHWRETGGSELANTQSFINALCRLIGVEPPHGSRADDAHNDYVFERRVFQDNGDGSVSFGRIDVYRRGAFILEAKQGSDADRAAAAQGEDDLDLFGQTATARMKRGTARRGTPGWAKAMVQAKGQAERYAKALPLDHGWPPFLLVTDIGYCIEVYADFTGSGKAYAQFPDRSRYRIMLEDLRDEDVRKRLATIWTNPTSLDPSAQAARVTREIAGLLATVSRRLEGRGHSPETVSGFLSRILFTMFAEDTGVLLPQDSFKTLLRGQLNHPEHLHYQLSALWAAMDKGEFAPALGIPVKRFNGYLFKDTAALPLERVELEVLIEAASKDWTEVEPAIFGTLLERALNPKERAKLGAHYTPRAYVERLVGPTIIEPLRADWAGVRVAATELIDQNKPDEARRTVEAFHGRLASTRVLDPACGTGNFLYVAMARMKELEGEVLDLLVELGDDQYLAELTGHTITPENFLGIEINPRAAAIAQLVLWIGYLQWHFRVNGRDRAPPEPILRDIRTIENRDALIEWDARELERDDAGAPVSRWDGETMKPHPATGRPVPDDSAQLEVYRYIKPRPANWPAADFIIGNPPFIGVRRINERLGVQYVKAVRSSYSALPATADYVMYWWEKAATAVREKRTRRFGLITTNSIVQDYSRPVMERHIDARERPLKLLYAVTNHPWVENADGAAVDVAMTVGGVRVDDRHARVGKVVGGRRDFRVEEASVTRINASLKDIPDVFRARALKANKNMCFQGVVPAGDGFKHKADPLNNEGCSKPYMIGDDITERLQTSQIIDFFGIGELSARSSYPRSYAIVYDGVKPERDLNTRDSYRVNWWIFAEPRPKMRQSIKAIQRYIATPYTARHRIFVFLDSKIVPDAMIYVVSSDDALNLGVLSSFVHQTWCKYAGGTLQDRPRYNSNRTFFPFPFPTDVSEPLKDRIRAESEALDALRRSVLAENEDLTLTGLYNVLEALRAADAGGSSLTPKYREVHDRALVTLLRKHHDAIDGLVAEAYGWARDHAAGRLTDAVILERLIKLNNERAAEEALGLVRYLRPDFQDPGYQTLVSATLDLGETAVVAPENIVVWPATLTEQVGAVQQVLAAAVVPMAAQDIARSFKGKRAATVRPVLDALAGLGMARRLNDGRYAT